MMEGHTGRGLERRVGGDGVLSELRVDRIPADEPGEPPLVVVAREDAPVLKGLARLVGADERDACTAFAEVARRGASHQALADDGDVEILHGHSVES